MRVLLAKQPKPHQEPDYKCTSAPPLRPAPFTGGAMSETQPRVSPSEAVFPRRRDGISSGPFVVGRVQSPVEHGHRLVGGVVRGRVRLQSHREHISGSAQLACRGGQCERCVAAEGPLSPALSRLCRPPASPCPVF